MDLEITTEDMMAIMKDGYREKAVDTLDQLIRYCRHVEKEYKEKDGEHSGLAMLGELLKQGAMKMDLYLKVREAVENYNTPYEITLRDGEEKV